MSKITVLLYSISMLMVPIAYYQPAAVSLYWATSGLMGVLINLILLHPPIRRGVRIPWIPAEHSDPYNYLWQKFLSRKFL